MKRKATQQGCISELNCERRKLKPRPEERTEVLHERRVSKAPDLSSVSEGCFFFFFFMVA